jgi:signal peptidase I
MLWEYAKAIFIALILALFIRTFVVQAFKIPSGSMKNTLLVGDHILVNKFIYGVRNPFTRELWIPVKKPERGDVVVFIYPQDREKDFIKRVVGVEGDTIQIINKNIYVNGKLFPNPEGIQHTDPDILPESLHPRDNMGPVTVPKGKIFVVGDNRDESYDSRFWGFVPVEDLKGEAFAIYWSWNSDKHWPRFGRIGDLVH